MEPFQGSAFSIGKPGRPNEDSFAIFQRSDGCNIYVIADGVGGSSSGRLAAEIAVETVREWALEGGDDMHIPFQVADEKLKALVTSQPDSFQSLATTLTVVLAKEGEARFAHVGDCRLYWLRGAGLRTLTEDQTEVRKLVELGVLPKSRAKEYKRSHVLLSALGSSRPYELQEGRIRLSAGDRLVLCSDGLYNSVAKKIVVDISTSSEEMRAFAASLEAETRRAQPTDDATAVLIEFRGEAGPY